MQGKQIGTCVSGTLFAESERSLRRLKISWTLEPPAKKSTSEPDSSESLIILEKV